MLVTLNSSLIIRFNVNPSLELSGMLIFNKTYLESYNKYLFIVIYQNFM